MTAKELQSLAVAAVASQFSYKQCPHTFARELLAKEPQLWAYDIALADLRSDGFKVTQQRKDAIWKALGGN